jgi:hypothetical protein
MLAGGDDCQRRLAAERHRLGLRGLELGAAKPPCPGVTGGENPRINGAVAPVGDVGAWSAVAAQRPEVLGWA